MDYHPHISPIYSCHVSDVNMYVTRSSINGVLSEPNVKLVAKKRTFPYIATMIWNEIPHSLRNASSLNIFKSAYTAQLFNDTNIT